MAESVDFFGWHHDDFQVNPSSNGYQTAIQDRLGNNINWHADWFPGSHINITTRDPEGLGGDFIYRWTFPPGGGAGTTVTDGNHIMLFPQGEHGLCPRAWMDAAWPFLEHFRSNFSIYPQEAFGYRRVSLIGAPTGDQFGLSQEIEDSLRQMPWRRVERITFRSADDLSNILRERIAHNIRFPEDSGSSSSVTSDSES